MLENIRCFISYSWESSAHIAWVIRLAENLQANGIFVRLDQWDTKPGMDLLRYMETSIRDSEFVLLVCTPVFAEKANTGKGGVGYEKNIVSGELFTRNVSETKFVPLLRSGTEDTSLPSYLRSKRYIDFRDDGAYITSLELLLRTVHDQPHSSRPALGPKPSFERLFPVVLNEQPTQHSTEIGEFSRGKAKIEKRAEQHLAEAPVFDLNRFDELRRYAYSPDGLNLSKADATQWAEQHLLDSPPFDIDRFGELRRYAYSPDGLNLSKADATQWAEQHLLDSPPFDIDRFGELRRYAYSPDGLNLSKTDATQWAEQHLVDSPPFDIDRFDELRRYAYSPDGLNLSKADATQWAEQHLVDSPPFDIDRFDELRRYAYSPDGLNLSKADARQWAERRLKAIL